MKVLLINTSEITGGAAIAASRLMNSLNICGIDAKMLVLHKSSQSAKVINIGKPWQKKCTFISERLVIWINNLFSRKNLFSVSIANSGFDITRTEEFKQADIIHLHWINQGFLSLNDLQKILNSGKPVVWTMHDMWPCTSICHHAYTCNAFKSECKNCQFLRFPNEKDLSNRVFWKKYNLLQNKNLNIVTVSTWLLNQVKQSTLLKDKKAYVIPNTLSVSDFIIMDKQMCRKELNLPDKYLILFGAARVDDPIKGFEILLEAIKKLTNSKRFDADQLHLVIFGKIKHPELIIDKIPISYSDIGLISDTHKLSQLYSAADVTVSASYYETFGQTLIEAQACGCLPISFGNSGQSDIIRHKENGYLADYLSAESLAEGIYWGITQGNRNISRESLRENVVQKYSGEIVAEQYIRLYNDMMKENF